MTFYALRINTYARQKDSVRIKFLVQSSFFFFFNTCFNLLWIMQVFFFSFVAVYIGVVQFALCH